MAALSCLLGARAELQLQLLTSSRHVSCVGSAGGKDVGYVWEAVILLPAARGLTAGSRRCYTGWQQVGLSLCNTAPNRLRHGLQPSQHVSQPRASDAQTKAVLS